MIGDAKQTPEELDWAQALEIAASTSITPLTSSQDEAATTSRPRHPRSKDIPKSISTALLKNGRSRRSTAPELTIAQLGRTILPSGAAKEMWESAFVVQTGFALKSKSNFRRYKGSQSSYLWRSLTDFEKALSELLNKHIPPTWQLAADKPVSQRPIVIALIIGRTTYDAANLSKSVLDAAQGVVVANDSTIRFVTESSIRTKKGQSGVIAFACLPPSTDLPGILKAGSELITTVSSLLSPDGYLIP